MGNQNRTTNMAGKDKIEIASGSKTLNAMKNSGVQGDKGFMGLK